jgi:GDP-D-mannose dehydratase
LTMPASKSNGEEVALVKKVLSNLLPQTSNLNVGDVLIEIDSRYLRPLEVEFLLV